MIMLAFFAHSHSRNPKDGQRGAGGGGVGIPELYITNINIDVLSNWKTPFAIGTTTFALACCLAHPHAILLIQHGVHLLVHGIQLHHLIHHSPLEPLGRPFPTALALGLQATAFASHDYVVAAAACTGARGM